jgi:hypothetical protein
MSLLHHGRKCRRAASVLIPLLIACAVTFGVPTTALATASAGYYLEHVVDEHSGYVDECGQTVIHDIADNRSWELTNTDPNGCDLHSNTWGAPIGYMGVNADGYFKGSYCGSTGYYYNQTSTYNFGVGGVECSGDGCGTYYTIASGTLYQYYAGSYGADWSEKSPNQTYYC